MERSTILLGGMPGGGKSRLGRSMASELRPEMSVEHLSIGDIVRAIGRGAIASRHHDHILNHLNSARAQQPINDEIMYNVTSEALSRSADTSLILLDGYPRYANQVEDIYELSMLDERHLAGLIVANTTDDIATMRMIKRSPRDYDKPHTVTSATERIRHHKRTYERNVVMELCCRELPVEVIDTSGDKEDTTRMGLIHARKFLQSDTTQD